MRIYHYVGLKADPQLPSRSVILTRSPAGVVVGVQVLETFAGDVGVDLGGGQVRVAEEHLD